VSVRLTLKLLYISCVQDFTDLQTVINEKGQNVPYILVCGGMAQPEQLMLMRDRHIICDICEDDVPFALMSAYFVFNICYVPGCHNVFKIGNPHCWALIPNSLH